MLIQSEDENTGLLATKAMNEQVSLIYEKNKEKFRFFGHMKAPLKRLQNKFRYQILMRILSGNQDIIDQIFYAVDVYNKKGVSVYLEINPNNLS